MKTLFSIPCRSVRVADPERLVFCFDDDSFVDIHGNPVPEEPGFRLPEISRDPWDSYWIEDEGIDEKLISETIEEPVHEIDDIFGKYGFKNRAGEFVIEPQYAYAEEFSHGLAAVNLNRTWYRTEDGRRYYENHFGYINGRGETVIPFIFDEAYPFTKYGVALVEDRKAGSYLIDLEGNVIPGTEKLSLYPNDSYDSRFFEFDYGQDAAYDGPVGIYDSAKRRILLEPSISSFTEISEDLLRIYIRDGEYGVSDFHQHFINGEGEVLFPWLYGKGFAIVEPPSKMGVSVVAFSNYTELSDEARVYCSHNGKKYNRDFLYGLYSSRERFVIPAEYDAIKELTDRIYGCFQNGVITLVQLEDKDFE